MKPVKGQPELMMQRKQSGVTQAELADVLGCIPAVISNYERGERATLTHGRGPAEYLEALAIASAMLPLGGVPTEG